MPSTYGVDLPGDSPLRGKPELARRPTWEIRRSQEILRTGRVPRLEGTRPSKPQKTADWGRDRPSCRTALSRLRPLARPSSLRPGDQYPSQATAEHRDHQCQDGESGEATVVVKSPPDRRERGGRNRSQLAVGSAMSSPSFRVSASVAIREDKFVIALMASSFVQSALGSARHAVVSWSHRRNSPSAVCSEHRGSRAQSPAAIIKSSRQAASTPDSLRAAHRSATAARRGRTTAKRSCKVRIAHNRGLDAAVSNATWVESISSSVTSEASRRRSSFPTSVSQPLSASPSTRLHWPPTSPPA